jgi:hypothetical protein
MSTAQVEPTASAFDTVPPLIFGIYPGGGVGTDPGSGLVLGAPDQPAQINAALDQLQPSERPFMLRGYLHYVGRRTIQHTTPADMVQYVRNGRQLELVVCYRTLDGDLEDWVGCVREIVQQYGPILTALQITEEPNNPDAATGGDGSFPNIHHAIIRGIQAAKDERQRQGHAFQIGFNATPSFNNDFWVELAAVGGAALGEATDYIGFDFFPDVFRPLPLLADGSPMPLQAAVAGVLRSFRTVNLAAAHIPASVPIHVTENGWPTSATRSYERQAEVLETIVRTIHAQRAVLNITHYEYFDLRDADSSSADLQFGLLCDDYTPKPAFERYRQLIAELG